MHLPTSPQALHSGERMLVPLIHSHLLRRMIRRPRVAGLCICKSARWQIKEVMDSFQYVSLCLLVFLDVLYVCLNECLLACSTCQQKSRFFLFFIFLFFLRSPAIFLRFTTFGWDFWVCDRFFYPTIKVVTFRLRGWCVLGVFLLKPFTRLGLERQDLLSPCDEMHVCAD